MSETDRDIVERLRDVYNSKGLYNSKHSGDFLICEVADEIERLRSGEGRGRPTAWAVYRRSSGLCDSPLTPIPEGVRGTHFHLLLSTAEECAAAWREDGYEVVIQALYTSAVQPEGERIEGDAFISGDDISFIRTAGEPFVQYDGPATLILHGEQGEDGR